MKWRPSPADLIPAAVALLAMFPLHNNDLWWHLATGRWIVEHLAVPRSDVFSWTHYLGAWVDNEWLGQVVVYGVWRLGGNVALIALRACLYAGLALLVRAFSREAFAPAIAVAVALSHHWWELRPSVFTLAALLLMLIAIERGREGWLVPLFLVWANVHPGFLFGLIVLAAVSVVKPPLWKVTPFCALATLVNPYGLRVYEQQFVIARNSHYRALLDEWVVPPVGFLLLATGFVICGALSLRRAPLHRLVFLFAGAFLSMTAVRFEECLGWIAAPVFFTLPMMVPRAEGGEARGGWLGPRLFVLLAAIVVGWNPPAANAIFAATAHHHGLVVRQRIASCVIAMLALFRPGGLRRRWVALTAAAAIAGGMFFVRTTVEPGRYPGSCLERLPPGTRVFHRLAWGGWLIWHGRASFIDGRCSGQRLFFGTVAAQTGRARPLLRLWGIEYVLASPEDGVSGQIRNAPEWILVCRDEASTLYRRRE